MRFEEFSFGSIRIDGVTYKYDVMIDHDNHTLSAGPHVTNIARQGAPKAPPDWEAGRKDTVLCPPGEITRIRVRFPTKGRFVWHCHILEHEDNEMMRPLKVL